MEHFHFHSKYMHIYFYLVLIKSDRLILRIIKLYFHITRYIFNIFFALDFWHDLSDITSLSGYKWNLNLRNVKLVSD